MPIIKDRDLLNQDGSIPVELIKKCIDNHKSMLDRYKRLDSYYYGEHKILSRTLSSELLPNNKLVCDHAEYITDMATGYVFGCPVSYSGEGSEKLNIIFTNIDEDSHNNELALDMSIFGVGYELLFMDDEEEHLFNGIPLIEYKSNKRLKGDYEGVTTIIDAYNLLQSDRVNDKEQMVDALLAVVGASLGDDGDEKIEAARLLKEMKTL